MNIAVEKFKFTKKIKPMNFFEYEVLGKGDISNVYKIVGKARYALTSQNRFKPVFSKENKLYSLEKLEIPELDYCFIEPRGFKKLSIDTNSSIYSDYLIYIINCYLKKKGYKVKYNKQILNDNILDRNGKYVQYRSSKGIEVKRCFEINPYVLNDGQVFLECNVKSIFNHKKNIYEMMESGENIIGLRVKYSWSNINSSGEIVEILDKNVNDKLETCMGQSLIEYFLNNNQEYRVKNFTEKDKKAKVVRVKMGKKILDFIPHSLQPIVDREYVKRVDPDFSVKVDSIFKMEMNYRFKVIKQFLNDIAVIKELENGYFDFNTCNQLDCFGFKCIYIDAPVLKGKTKLQKKAQVFNKGYYKTVDKEVKVGIMFPEGTENDVKTAIRRIWDFNTIGKIKNNTGKEYTVASKGLINLRFNRNVWCSYPLGSITEYKRIANDLKNKGDLDIILAVIPDSSDDPDNPYSPFKRVLAELQLPSQMMTLDSVKAINDFDNIENVYEYKGLYYIHNISLGILGKVGGIPWVIDNPQSPVDCYVGLDVGNPIKGIRYPSCSIVFDRDGTLINYYRPKIPQTGEIIVTDILQEIFDKVLLSYYEKHNSYPKKIMIHRDGFARESLDWYKNYFREHNIEFDIVEIRKHGAIKFGEIDKDFIYNPKPGTYITDGQVAYLISSEIRPLKGDSKTKIGFGSPVPLQIERVYGSTDLHEIVKQVYYLSELHIGSTKSTRLPITTGYADKISKNIDTIPSGCVDNKLFFL